MKLLSLVLRHNPEVIGISLDEHGWANVDELVRGVRSQYPNFTAEQLEEIVAADDKQRYSFNEGKTRIRANQGHSINVDVELEERKPPEFLWHGTGQKYVQSICSSGLLPKSRLYVHLSADMRTAIGVGKRHGEVALFRIDTEQMYKDGFKFYFSKNGVWLTKEVPVKYLSGTIVLKE